MDSSRTDRPPAQLSSIKAQLDLVLLALEALVGIGSEAILAAAQELQLDSLLPDRVSLWRLRQSSPLRKGQGRKKLDVDEARALVLITCRLATAHHGLIRQAVARLEQLTEQGQPPHRAAVLGDYLDNFSNTYLERMVDDSALPAAKTPEPTELAQLALQLLIDLLFYSSPGGVRRLWLSLVDRAG
ncbi:DUF3038 domain-containing protein [Vasconcelosia minhoensis]|uniref:DUF3038 domain-containing protein n=1 Tax=Vasconcelosia minhoensis TaxID=3366354 RepID=UPI002AD45138|nr:DUF3038 domain-containing protein [Romeria gracilis]